MQAKDHDIPIAFIREALTIGPNPDELTWLVRPRKHFMAEYAWRRFNDTWARTRADHVAGDGYRRVRLTFVGRHHSFKAHRVIFALTHGHWPPNQLDHENRNRLSNQPANLREATRSENAQNTDLRSDNTTGVKGVAKYRYKCKHGYNEKWQAYLDVGGHRVFHRVCDTFDEAVKARQEAEIIYHPFRPGAGS
jgi:HNH endonuclease